MIEIIWEYLCALKFQTILDESPSFKTRILFLDKISVMTINLQLQGMRGRMIMLILKANSRFVSS
jgi:hypothetical protein